MRNYFKMRSLKLWPLPFDQFNFYVVVGGDDDQLRFYQQRLMNSVGGEFLVSEPAVIWFELDQENFGKLLNQAWGTIWTQTHLNNVFPPIDDNETLYDMTRVITEGSPRKTWSHGH